MKKSRYTAEQITFALCQAEAYRQILVSEASTYVRKRNYGQLELTEILEFHQLSGE